MKIYVHANQNTANTVETIEITVDLAFEYASIAAAKTTKSKSNQLKKRYIVDPVTDELVDSVYRDLLRQIGSLANEMGLFRVHKESSNSNSRYRDYCISDRKDSKTVRVMLFFRVSDHHDWSEKERKEHIEDRLRYYQTGNKAPTDKRTYRGGVDQLGKNNLGGHGSISVIIENITVGSKEFNTIPDALEEVRRIFARLIAAEARPFDRATAVKFVDQLRDKLRNLEVRNSWDVTTDANTMTDSTSFRVYFNGKSLSGKYTSQIELLIEFIPPPPFSIDDYGYVSVVLHISGKSQQHLFDVKCKKTHMSSNIFADNSFQRLFSRHISDVIKSADNDMIL